MSDPPPEPGWGARIGWFLALWLAGVVTLGVVTAVLRWAFAR